VGGEILEEAIDVYLQIAAIQVDFILVPLADGFLVRGVELEGAAALGACRLDLHRDVVDVPYVTHIARHSLGLDGLRPDLVRADHPQQDAAVACLDVPQLQPQDIAGVVLDCADVAGRAASISDYTVLNAEGVLELVAGESPA